MVKKLREKMQTSLVLDPEVWKLAKKASIDRGITLGEFVEKAIKAELRGDYA